jgi:hypothetical protein
MECKYCGKNFRAKNAIFCSKICYTYYSTKLEKNNGSNYDRVTISMNQDVSKNLRTIQSNLIRNTNENISFSQVVNLILEEGIKIKNWS